MSLEEKTAIAENMDATETAAEQNNSRQQPKRSVNNGKNELSKRQKYNEDNNSQQTSMDNGNSTPEEDNQDIDTEAGGSGKKQETFGIDWSQTENETDVEFQQVLANSLIDSTKTPEQIAAENKQAKTERANIQLVLDVFPAADNEFIRAKLFEEKIGVEQLIQRMLADATYPRRVDREKKERNEQKRLRILSDFDVNEFLRRFEDPETYFSDQTRVVTDNYAKHALAVLSNMDFGCSKQFLQGILKHHSNHLTPTWDYLNQNRSRKGPHQYTKDLPSELIKLSKAATVMRPNRPCPWPEEIDEQFFWEYHFINNRENILGTIGQRRIVREQTVAEARDNNLLTECAICTRDDVLPDEMMNCGKMDADGLPIHRFCDQCLAGTTNATVSEGGHNIGCLYLDCNESISHNRLQNVIKPEVLDRLLRAAQRDELRMADIENIESCPFCDFSVINENKENRVFDCLNPDCLKKSCRDCRKASHIPLKCAEVENDVQVHYRTYVENKMAEAMIRKCPRCNVPIVKLSGCNMMQCQSCHTQMCYVCKQQIYGYGHFNSRDPSSGCHVHTDTDSVHADVSVKAGLEAERAYAIEFPERAAELQAIRAGAGPSGTEGSQNATGDVKKQIMNVEQLVDRERVGRYMGRFGERGGEGFDEGRGGCFGGEYGRWERRFRRIDEFGRREDHGFGGGGAYGRKENHGFGGGGAYGRREDHGFGGGGAYGRREDHGFGGGGAFGSRDDHGFGGGGTYGRKEDHGFGGGGAFGRREGHGFGGGGAFGRREDHGFGGGGAFGRREDHGFGGGGAFGRREHHGFGGGGTFDRREDHELVGGGGFGRRDEHELVGGGGFGRREDHGLVGVDGFGERGNQGFDLYDQMNMIQYGHMNMERDFGDMERQRVDHGEINRQRPTQQAMNTIGGSGHGETTFIDSIFRQVNQALPNVERQHLLEYLNENRDQLTQSKLSKNQLGASVIRHFTTNPIEHHPRTTRPTGLGGRGRGMNRQPLTVPLPVGVPEQRERTTDSLFDKLTMEQNLEWTKRQKGIKQPTGGIGRGKKMTEKKQKEIDDYALNQLESQTKDSNKHYPTAVVTNPDLTELENENIRIENLIEEQLIPIERQIHTIRQNPVAIHGFPVHEYEKQLKNMRQRLKQMSSEHKEAIHAVHPYRLNTKCQYVKDQRQYLRQKHNKALKKLDREADVAAAELNEISPVFNQGPAVEPMVQTNSNQQEPIQGQAPTNDTETEKLKRATRENQMMHLKQLTRTYNDEFKQANCEYRCTQSPMVRHRLQAIRKKMKENQDKIARLRLEEELQDHVSAVIADAAARQISNADDDGMPMGHIDRLMLHVNEILPNVTRQHVLEYLHEARAQLKIQPLSELSISVLNHFLNSPEHKLSQESGVKKPSEDAPGESLSAATIDRLYDFLHQLLPDVTRAQLLFYLNGDFKTFLYLKKMTFLEMCGKVLLYFVENPVKSKTEITGAAKCEICFELLLEENGKDLAKPICSSGCTLNYHKHCIERWLDKNGASCPNCRRKWPLHEIFPLIQNIPETKQRFSNSKPADGVKKKNSQDVGSIRKQLEQQKMKCVKTANDLERQQAKELKHGQFTEKTMAAARAKHEQVVAQSLNELRATEARLDRKAQDLRSDTLCLELSANRDQEQVKRLEQLLEQQYSQLGKKEPQANGTAAASASAACETAASTSTSNINTQTEIDRFMEMIKNTPELKAKMRQFLIDTDKSHKKKPPNQDDDYVLVDLATSENEEEKKEGTPESTGEMDVETQLPVPAVTARPAEPAVADTIVSVPAPATELGTVMRYPLFPTTLDGCGDDAFVAYVQERTNETMDER